MAQRFLKAEGPESGPSSVSFVGSAPGTDLEYEVKETPTQVLDMVKALMAAGGGCGQARQAPPMMQQQSPRPSTPGPVMGTPVNTAPPPQIKRDLK